MDTRPDSQLLTDTAAQPEAFAVFYRRHVRCVLAYTLSRTRRPELAADITAEVFATALERCERYDPRRGPARAWLLTMASSKLIDAARRGRVEDRARRRLQIPPRELTDTDLERIERDLVDAAERQARRRRTADVRRWSLSRRGFAIALTGLLVAGSATAAVVTLTSEPSKPLSGPIPETHERDRAYAISLLPDLRAGQAGWCTTLRLTFNGRMTSSAMSCGAAPALGGHAISGGVALFGDVLIQHSVVTADVASVRLDDGRLFASRQDRSLPHGWRAVGRDRPRTHPRSGPAAPTRPDPDVTYWTPAHAGRPASCPARRRWADAAEQDAGRSPHARRSYAARHLRSPRPPLRDRYGARLPRGLCPRSRRPAAGTAADRGPSLRILRADGLSPAWRGRLDQRRDPT